MTRMQKWADKRAEIEQEAKEIQDAIRLEEKQIFDDMMDNPIQALEELCDEIDRR